MDELRCFFAFQTGVNRFKTTGLITPAATLVEVILLLSKAIKDLWLFSNSSQKEIPAIPSPTTI